MAIDPNLQKLHAPVDLEIVQLLLSIIPETWWSVRFEVEYISSPTEGDGYPMSISNHEGEKDIVVPPDSLFELVRQHSLIFQEHGEQWKRLVYDLTYDEQAEDWQYKIDYSYE